MPAHFVTLVCIWMVLGCTHKAEQRNSWISPSLVLEDTAAITVVCDGGLMLDGGTIELYAVTRAGHRCLIRLNQRKLYGDYRLNSIDSPGRLSFSDRLIDVRSIGEQKVLDLLSNANFIPIGIEGLRQLVGNPNIETKTLLSLASDSPSPNTKAFRDEIVDFVQSDLYVDVAQHGLKHPSQYDASPAMP